MRTSLQKLILLPVHGIAACLLLLRVGEGKTTHQMNSVPTSTMPTATGA